MYEDRTTTLDGKSPTGLGLYYLTESAGTSAEKINMAKPMDTAEFAAEEVPMAEVVKDLSKSLDPATSQKEESARERTPADEGAREKQTMVMKATEMNYFVKKGAKIVKSQEKNAAAVVKDLTTRIDKRSTCTAHPKSTLQLSARRTRRRRGGRHRGNRRWSAWSCRHSGRRTRTR